VHLFEGETKSSAAKLDAFARAVDAIGTSTATS
jgi:hypothetical protein